MLEGYAHLMLLGTDAHTEGTEVLWLCRFDKTYVDADSLHAAISETGACILDHGYDHPEEEMISVIVFTSHFSEELGDYERYIAHIGANIDTAMSQSSYGTTRSINPAPNLPSSE